MGRYISTGIIYQYGLAKSSIPGIESSEVKQQLIEQLFPEIYDFWDDDYFIYFTLSSKIIVSDLISAMESYLNLVGLIKEESEEFEQVKNILAGKTEKKPSYLYQADELGFSYAYYAIPLVLNGKRKFYPAHIWAIMIDQSNAKTITEDDLLSYDFFTDLLRYRMKPAKLADVMLIYLSI